MQEYANDIIYALAEACRENEVPMPHVISESGRALTAHHALLLINVVDLETQSPESPDPVGEDDHALVQELAGVYSELDAQRVTRCTTTPRSLKEQLRVHFNSGTLACASAPTASATGWPS